MTGVESRLQEALAAVASAKAAGLDLRLLGGLAIRATSPSACLPPLARDCGDMDFVALGSPKKIETFLQGLGWVGDPEFNLYNGELRLIFHSPAGTKADIFIRHFAMCHSLDFSGRLGASYPTIPLADLLLTKLQVREVNPKDLSDSAALLLDHGLGAEGSDTIGLPRLKDVLGDDWGFWKTCRDNLGKLEAFVATLALEAKDHATLAQGVHSLKAFLDTCPKSTKWKLRSLVGEKLPWYETPEDAEA